MAEVAKVVAKFEADTSNLQAGAKRVQSTMGGIQQDVGKAAKGFTVLRGAMGTAFGVAGVAAISAAGRAMINFARDAVAMAEESQMTVRRIENIAQSMGILDTALGGTTDRLTDYAQALQDQTGVSDETIKNAQALILTFSEVASSAGEAGGMFDRTTAAALDLAAAGFGNVEGNARSLARALQDPLRGLTMLSRQGVTFTETEQEKIKALVESNDLLGAQEIIMAAVEKQVGGTAAATATSMDKMKASLADVQENIGFGLLPVIESIASAFQTHVTPALLEFSGNIKENTGPAIAEGFAEILPTILDLAETLLGAAAVMREAMAPAISALMALIQATLPLIEGLAEMFSNIPSPIMAVIGALLLLRTRMMQTLIATMGTAKTRVTTAFTQMRTSAITFGNTMKSEMIKTRTQLGALGAAARVASVTVVGAFRSIAIAAKTLMVSIGPIGWAMLGLTVAFEMFTSRSMAAEQATEAYIDALDSVTGAATQASSEILAMNLLTTEATSRFHESKFAVQDLADKAGISMGEIVRAVQGSNEEYEAMHARLREAAAAGDLTNEEFLALTETLSRERDAIDNARAAIEISNEATAVATGTIGDYDDATVRAMKATGEFESAQVAYEQRQRASAEVTKQTAEAVRALQDAFNDLNELTSDIRAADKAADAWKTLTTGLIENGDGFSRATEAQRENRDNLLDYIDAQTAYAKSLETPQEQLEALEKLEARVKKALKEGGVKPEDSALYKSVQESVAAAKEEVDDMQTAVEDANTKGVDVAEAIALGIEQGMGQAESAINAAGMAGGQALSDGFEDSLEIGSPSQVAIDAGRYTGIGLRVGMLGSAPIVSDAGKTVGDALIQGVINGMNMKSNALYGRIRQIVQTAINAAKDQAGISSPSKVTERMGEDLVDGFTIGMRKRSGGAQREAGKVARRIADQFALLMRPDDRGGPATSAFESMYGSRDDIRNASRALRDAVWTLADSRDAVAQSKKALAEARKEGSAREVAAAKRDLAQARRDAQDAADAAKAARFVAENKKALLALEKIVQQYDYVTDALNSSTGALSELTNLVATPFGLESALSQMFGADVSVDRLADNFFSLADTVREAFAVLVDPEIVGTRAARRNRRTMDNLLGEIEDYVADMIGLRQQYDANLQELAENEKQWQIDERELSGNLDKVTQAYDEATRNLESIVNERDGFIDKITGGFRSFVNSLSGMSSEVTREVTKETRQFANGVQYIIRTTEKESVASTNSIAEILRGRLAEVREFSANIRNLMERGLDPALVRDFIESGVSGAGETVAALASATDAELQAINETQAALLQHAQEFASAAGDKYYGTLISEQRDVVAGLKSQVDAAQKELDDARTAYDVERARLQAENQRLEGEINGLAAKIDALITNLAATLPAETMQAGQAAIDSMIAGFEDKFPGMKKYFNQLMDELAASMQRTIDVNIRTIGPATSMNRASSITRTARMDTVTVAPVPEGTFTPTAGVTSAGTTVINLNITAGVGDPREIGRVAVEAIEAYERSSGRVFVRA